MADQIHKDENGKYSFAYVGEPGWHHKGQQLTQDAPIPQWIVEAGFDWEIKEAQVFGLMGEQASATGPALPDDMIWMPDKKMLFRSDNRTPLAIVGQKYNVIQPPEIIKFYEDLVAAGGFHLETAGVLFGGRRMFALAKCNEGVEVLNGDLVKQYLLLSTACDGTMATQVRNTSVRVVCDNTLQMAFSDSLPMIKIPHSAKFDAKKIKEQLGLLPGSFDSFIEDMRQLADRKLNNNEAIQFLVGLFGDPTEKLEDQEVKAANLMKQVYELYTKCGVGREIAGQTAWGMLNAVTEYTDHHTGHKTDDARIDSAWFGGNANLKQKAYQDLMLMVA